MPDWVGLDIRKASLDKDVRTRAVVVSADDYVAAVNAAVRQLGLATAHRGFAFVRAIADDESVADAVSRVKRDAAEKRLEAEGRARVPVVSGPKKRGSS